VIKADPERNMSSSASLYSLSRQVCLSFQFLGPSRAISRIMGTPARSDAFQSYSIRLEEAKASQSDGACSFKLSLHVSGKVPLILI
jgi:hypothetical protein